MLYGFTIRPTGTINLAYYILLVVFFSFSAWLLKQYCDNTLKFAKNNIKARIRNDINLSEAQKRSELVQVKNTVADSLFVSVSLVL